MDSTPVVRIVQQQSTGDCVIATLAMYFGLKYEDVLAVAVLQLQNKRVHKVGMYDCEILAIAEQLKQPLAKRRKFDIDTACGIMVLNRKKVPRAHVVFLKNGLVFDTDGTVWEPDTYFTHTHFKPTAIFARMTDEKEDE